MSEQDDNFLSRWSRRKALVRQGVEPPVAAPPAAVPPLAVVPAAALVAGQPAVAADGVRPRDSVAETAAPAVAAPPKLTLDDVEALTPESDFSRFIARDVDEKVKNSAMKKLFADPHYNVMDGLDIYIGDYNTPDPLPKAVLRQMVQARMLGLLDDDMPEQPAANETAQATSASADVVAEVEAELSAETAAEASNDAPELAAANDEPVVNAAHAEDSAVVAERETDQPGAGSSSSAS